MLGSGMNVVTTVIGFGMSATFIVFVCARLICGRIRSADGARAAAHLDVPSDTDSREHSINGLDPPVVAAMPTMKYHKEGFHSRQDVQCCICLGEYQEKEVLRIMPECSHSFHSVCIDVWLQKQSTCPICRLPLNNSSGAKHKDIPVFGILPPMRSPVSRGDYSSPMLLGDRHSRGNQATQSVHQSGSAEEPF